jgi:hypothetical protein
LAALSARNGHVLFDRGAGASASALQRQHMDVFEHQFAALIAERDGKMEDSTLVVLRFYR